MSAIRDQNLTLTWIHDQQSVDWEQLSNLYRIAPLGEKSANDLQTTYSNSMYKCFVYENDQLVGAGRAIADGVDCSYLCDIAVHPDRQGTGLGKAIVNKLVEFSQGHKKIILYANPGKEGFYKKLGFQSMNTAMAIFKDQQHALDVGLVRENK